MSHKTLVGWCGAVLSVILMLTMVQAAAAEEEQKSAPPLPLHSVEGTGGHFATHSAYLVNPAKPGEIFGLPSIGGRHVHFGNGRHLEDLTVTETLWDRLELGYAWSHFDMGDLPQDIERATTIQISDRSVDLHHFNARLSLWKDGDFGQAWLPALTVGAHYKYNDTIEDIDDESYREYWSE